MLICNIRIIRSRMLIERLHLSPYANVFRYDPFNRKARVCMTVPLCRSNYSANIESLDQVADHARTYNFFISQLIQSKCVLIKINFKFGQFNKITSNKRYYSCQVNSNFDKIDASLNGITTLTASRQELGNYEMVNLGYLYVLKGEIESQADNLTPLIIKSLAKQY